MHWLGCGFGILPVFLVFFFWVAIAVLVVVLLVRLVRGTTGSNGRKSGAEEILKQRYARGEITKEQYDEMLERIRR